MDNSEVPSSDALRATVAAFRLGMEAQASENLLKVIDFITPLVQNPIYQHRKNMNAVLTELLAAQMRKDYLYAADLLEYELTKWLTGCERGKRTYGRQ